MRRARLVEPGWLYQRAPWPIAIDRERPLAEADRAQRLLRAGGLRGRVVLTMSDR